MRSGSAPIMILAVMLAAACQSQNQTTRPASQPGNGAGAPAVLVSADPQTMAVVKSVLADAMGRARIELGPGDPTATSRISVLPPRLGPDETRSPATPTQFDLMIEGRSCYLVRQDSGARFALDGVACQPL